MTTGYDVIVLGAGALGSAAAYHAAARGLRVLVLEQYAIDHERGSSYGYSRIIRYSYDYVQYIELAKAAYAAWRALEADAGETLYTRTGGADFGIPGHEASLDGMLTSMAALNMPHTVWDADEAMRHFPQFRLDDGMIMLYQEDAGILAASKCVRAHVRLAEARGAEVRTGVRVTAIHPAGGGVSVETDAGVFSGGRGVVTAGAWARDLLVPLGLDLPLRPVKCQENYFDVADPAPFAVGRFPAFIAHLPEYGYMPYGIPSIDGSGLKVALHGGPNYSPHTPDRITDVSAIETALRFMAAHLPGAHAVHRASRVCLYTMTPDEHFILDTHPEHPQIVIGACCSGHAFKFSTLIGRILIDLAQTGTTPHDLSLFPLARFAAV
jgi:sarcosine oxidase